MKRSLTLKSLILVLATLALGIFASGCASSDPSYGGVTDPTKTSLPGTRAYPTLKADAFGGVSIN